MTALTALTAPKAILFDWDNTLVDNWASITAALNATLKAFNGQQLTEDQVRGMVRHSMRDSFPKMFGNDWHEARTIFYDSFRSNHLETLKPLNGAGDLLQDLKALDLYIGIVSNKGGEFLRKEIDHLDWKAFFHSAIGAGDAEEDKPAIAPVDLALEASGIDRSDAVWFIGDAAVDMECAIAAGCTPVLRASGDEPEEAFKDYPPKAVANSSADIFRLVANALQTI